MAEYIDRFIIGGLVDSHNNVHYEDIKGIPTADVIERSKIDKAIEELQNMKVYARTRTARLVSLPEVLEILKRNIGGDK